MTFRSDIIQSEATPSYNVLISYEFEPLQGQEFSLLHSAHTGSGA
jgi:hypothetical protein